MNPSSKGEGADLAPSPLPTSPEQKQEDIDQFVDSMADAPEEDYNRKMEELVRKAADATNAGRDGEARELAMTMLLLAGARALKHPTPDTELAHEVSEREEARDWAGAEAANLRLLELREGSGNPGMIAHARFQLSRLYRLLGRSDEAWSNALAATDSARKADLSPLIVMTLENEAFCALDRKDAAHALAAVEEATKFIGPERLQNGRRMATYLTRAECRVENGDLAGAEQDLQSAGELESDLGLAAMGGGFTVRARRREIEADLHVRRADWSKAEDALKQAIAFRCEAGQGCGSASGYALAARARALQRLAEVYRMLGNMAGMEESLAEAKSLRDQARLP